MEDAIAQVAGGSTRDDLREQKKGSASGRSKAKPFSFVFRPKDGPYRLNISFQKSRVQKEELIDALRQVLRQLESGQIPVGKRG
jgi:hypothetical protein